MQHSMHVKIEETDFRVLQQKARTERISLSALVRQRLLSGIDITTQKKPMPALEKPVSDETIECRRCKEKFEISKGITETITLKQGGFHLKLMCPACSNFIKFLSHEEPRIYAGQYAGQTIEEIKKTDPQYLQWYLQNGNLSQGTKNKIKEILNG